MDAAIPEDPPPDSKDQAGWREAVAAGHLLDYREEALVAAAQDLDREVGRPAVNGIVRELSDRFMRWARKRVGTNHPNRGMDIIHRAHMKMIEALARPQSADGKGFRSKFWLYARYRLSDAIAEEGRANRVPDDNAKAKLKAESEKKAKRRAAKKAGEQSPAEADEVELVGIDQHPDLQDDEERDDDGRSHTPARLDPTLMASARDTEAQAWINSFLERNVPNPKKRQAFRLFMDEFPAKSTRSDSIAKAVGIDEGTARDWIEELQEELAKKWRQQ
jgi:RNA polymerase sigma factor (sigma-70 family)